MNKRFLGYEIEQEFLRNHFETRVRHMLEYNPETGNLHWLYRPATRIRYWDIAGFTDPKGYVIIRIEGRNWPAHRLAFLFMTGSLPQCEIDHIDNNPSNNVWRNLRRADANGNRRNRVMLPNNTTGYRGVFLVDSKKNPYRAQIGCDYAKLQIGSYETAEIAALAYDQAARLLHGDFASFNFPEKTDINVLSEKLLKKLKQYEPEISTTEYSPEQYSRLMAYEDPYAALKEKYADRLEAVMKQPLVSTKEAA